MPLLGFAQGGLRGREIVLQHRLTLSQLMLLPAMGSNLRGQWRQQCIEFGFAGELVPLRSEMFQPGQLQALVGQTFPLLLGAVQLLGRRVLRVLQLTKILEPGVLLLKLLELRLLHFSCCCASLKRSSSSARASGDNGVTPLAWSCSNLCASRASLVLSKARRPRRV